MELLDVNNKSYHCKNTPPQKKSPAKVHAETLCHVKKVIAEVKHVGRMTGIYRNRKLVKRGGGVLGLRSVLWLAVASPARGEVLGPLRCRAQTQNQAAEEEVELTPSCHSFVRTVPLCLLWHPPEHQRPYLSANIYAWVMPHWPTGTGELRAFIIAHSHWESLSCVKVAPNIFGGRK